MRRPRDGSGVTVVRLGRQSWRIVGVWAERLDGEQRVPADGQLRELQLVEGQFRAAQSLIVLESLLTLPEHHQKGPAEDVACWVAEGLLERRLRAVRHHLRLPLLQPPIVVLQVCLYVRVWKIDAIALENWLSSQTAVILLSSPGAESFEDPTMFLAQTTSTSSCPFVMRSPSFTSPWEILLRWPLGRIWPGPNRVDSPLKFLHCSRLPHPHKDHSKPLLIHKFGRLPL